MGFALVAFTPKLNRSKLDSNRLASNPLQKVVSIHFEVDSHLQSRNIRIICMLIDQSMLTCARGDSMRKRWLAGLMTKRRFLWAYGAAQLSRVNSIACMTQNWTIFKRITIFAGTVQTVIVKQHSHYGDVAKTTLHVWVCSSVNARKWIEPVWICTDANQFECAFNPVCSMNGP